MSELSMGIFTGPNIFIEIAIMLVFIIYCIITFVMNYVMIVSEYGGQFSV